MSFDKCKNCFIKGIIKYENVAKSGRFQIIQLENFRLWLLFHPCMQGVQQGTSLPPRAQPEAWSSTKRSPGVLGGGRPQMSRTSTSTLACQGAP